MKLFPQIPEDISGLTDDEIADLIAQSEAALDKVDAGETEGISQSELYDEVKTGVEGLEKLRGEATARAEAATEQAEKMAELLARGRGGNDDANDDDKADQPTGDGDGAEQPTGDGADKPAADDADGEDDEAKKKDEIKVAASAEEIALAVGTEVAKVFAEARGTSGDRIIEKARENNERLRVGGVRDEHRPIAASTDVAIVASADVPGFPMGAPITDPTAIAKAIMKRYANLGTATMDGEKVPVIQMSWADGYPDERKLPEGIDEQGIMRRVREVVGDAPKGRVALDALTAAGGLCAPVEIRYELEVLAQADRPVRDSLPNFNAARGGLRFATPPSLASITTGVGRITAAQDASGATKACQVIACPSFVEVDTAAIYHCLQFGNLASRTYPELIENATELTLAAQSRLAETALLDSMSAASTHATVALQPDSTHPLGANAILLPALLRGAAAMRNRQRMDPEATLDVQMPAWTLDLLTSDLVRSAFDRFEQNDASIIRTMESYGLRVNFYWDGLTAVAQTFGAQSNNAALLEFPPTVEVFMYPAGSFLLLDGGTLDLGLVRDSTLNRTNDYQIFAETWENLAFVGLESLRISASVCDTGAVAAAVQAVCGS